MGASINGKHRLWAGAYIAFLLTLLTAALLSRPERSIDFYAYYSALTWSARTGQSPYYLWNGDPTVPRESDQYAYSLRLWPGHVPPRFIYPPSAMPLLRPFTWAPTLQAASRVWAFFNVAAFVVIVFLARALGPARRSLLLYLLLIGAYGPLRQGMWLGQVSLWLSLLLLAYVYCLKRGSGFLAGVALGLATGLKIFPLFWAPVAWLYPRAWRGAALGFVAAVAGCVGLSVALHGVEAWRQYYDLVFTRLALYPPHGSISLHSFLGVGDSWARRALFWALYAPAAGILLWRRPLGQGGRRRALLMLTVAIHLGMPLTWDHYLAFLGALLAIELASVLSQWARRLSLTMIGLLLVYFLTGCGGMVEALGLWPPTLGSSGLSATAQLARAGLIASAFLIPAVRLDLALLWRRKAARAQER